MPRYFARWIGSTSCFANGPRQVDIQIGERSHRITHQSLLTGHAHLAIEFFDEYRGWIPSAFPLEIRDLGNVHSPYKQFSEGVPVPEFKRTQEGVQTVIFPMEQTRKYFIRRADGGTMVQTEEKDGEEVTKGLPFLELRYFPQEQQARQVKGELPPVELEELEGLGDFEE